MVLSEYISKDAIYQGMTERTENPPNPDCLSTKISNLFRSVNSGTITINIGEQPFLRLRINEGYSNKIKLEFGQKFVEVLWVIGIESISGRTSSTT
jgi:hypothetical protein